MPPAREGLAWHIIDAIEYSQHELPRIYLGDAVDDLASLQQVAALVAEPVAVGVRQIVEERVTALRHAAEAWTNKR